MMNFNENPAQNILYNYAFEFIKEEICETRKLIDDYKLKEQKLQALKFKGFLLKFFNKISLFSLQN